jgi:hypothetical protein
MSSSCDHLVALLLSIDSSSFFRQAVIDADVMNHVVVLLKSSETDIQKEAAWAISNAASGGSSDHIQ